MCNVQGLTYPQIASFSSKGVTELFFESLGKSHQTSPKQIYMYFVFFRLN